MYYTDTQIKILQAIAKYKYMTVSQLDILQILKHKVSLYRVLTKLKSSSKALINYQDFNFNPKIGKLEQLLYLSKYGKNLLVEELGIDEHTIKAPTSNTLINQDYFHRVWTIDFHIYLDIFLKKESGVIYMFDYYFDKAKRLKGAKYTRARNRIDIKVNQKFIIPDAVIKLRYKTKEYLYLFEQHNSKDSGKIITQILNHCLVIQESGAKEKYKFDRNSRVIIVFEFESTKSAVIKKIKNNQSLQKFKNFFLLKTHTDLKELCFNDGWTNLHGEKIDFF